MSETKWLIKSIDWHSAARAITQEIPMNSFLNMCYEVTLLHLVPQLPVADELTVEEM